MTKPERPNGRRNLDIATDRLCIRTGRESTRVKRLIATVTVGQMLLNGAAKGGNALKVRFSKDVACFSRDLDTTRASSLKEYVSRLEDSLANGWSGFTEITVPEEPASPRGVPTACVMRPFNIKLTYDGKFWMTLSLEVGHNEVGDAEDPGVVSSSEVTTILRELGLPEPTPVPYMWLEYQIARGLHALNEVGGKRTHDLINLQIAVTGGNPDYFEAQKICVWLFEYRREQGWPPTLVKEEGWESLYGVQARGLSVLPSVDDAVGRANSLVAKIEASV